MRNIFQKITSFAKKEKRLSLTGVFLLAVFLLNHLLFSSQKIIPEDCLAGKCAASKTEEPQLSKEKGFFYLDDILKDVPPGYYRLTFQTKADREENVSVKLNTYTEKNETIGEAPVKVSEKFQNQELFLFLPAGFDNILFEKENPDGAGNIFIKNAGLTKLNVDNKKDFAAMRKTMVGEINTDSIGASQLQVSADSYSMLQEPKMILGQIFKAPDEYISGVSFNMDIIKNPNSADKQYKLSLWEVKCDEGDCRTAGEAIAKKSFSVKDAVEKYRRQDGTFLFPLYANVEKGKDYFAGIDNSNIKADRKNYLNLRGVRDDAGYPNGSVGMKKGGTVYKIGGDLFFAVRGVNLDIRDGARLLNGARIESLGKGQGKYTYAAKGEFLDILDLRSASSGTNFDEDKKVIVAGAKAGSALIYEINTIFPMQKLHFFAEQTDIKWKKMKVAYSFDLKNWTEAPFFEKINQESIIDKYGNQKDGADEKISAEESARTKEKEIVYFRTASDLTDLNNIEYSFDQKSWNKASVFKKMDQKSLKIADDNQAYSVNSRAFADKTKKDEEKSAQIFDFDVAPSHGEKTVYFKITPDLNDSTKANYFSFKNLRITADLTIK